MTIEIKTNFSVIKKLFNIKTSCGYEDDIMDETVKRLGGNLPKTFIDYYKELGKNGAVNHTQDTLIEPQELEIFKDKYLIFYAENQYVCVWGIKKEDLKKDNPPVYISYDRETWLLESEELTSFLVTMAHLQAVFGLEYTTEEFYQVDEEGVEIIRKKYKNKGWCLPNWLSIEFYGNEDDSIIALMKNMDEYDLIYASSNREHFEEMDMYFEKNLLSKH